jgi:hypothetical protein
LQTAENKKIVSRGQIEIRCYRYQLRLYSAAGIGKDCVLLKQHICRAGGRTNGVREPDGELVHPETAHDQVNGSDVDRRDKRERLRKEATTSNRYFTTTVSSSAQQDATGASHTGAGQQRKEDKWSEGETEAHRHTLPFRPFWLVGERFILLNTRCPELFMNTRRDLTLCRLHTSFMDNPGIDQPHTRRITAP